VPVEFGGWGLGWTEITALWAARHRHWRNARTVASHNPRIFKAKVLGAFQVNGTPPPYAWGIGRTER
jgi:hypothetical protein